MTKNRLLVDIPKAEEFIAKELVVRAKLKEDGLSKTERCRKRLIEDSYINFINKKYKSIKNENK